MSFFTRKEAEAIKNYKGGVTNDNGIFYVYFINPLCKALVQYYPTWIAPNLLTFLGLVCNIISYFLVYYYSPNLPSWVFPTIAFLTFSYVVLDNTDGKQAFRTGSSSPMGEIFDHGCDSLIVAVGALSLGVILKISSWDVLALFSIGLWTFIMPHWVEYFVHTLDFGALNGPTEAEMLGILIMLGPFFLGNDVYLTEIDIGIYQGPLNKLAFYLYVVATVYTTLENIVFGLKKSKEKGVPLGSSLVKLFPFTLTFIFGALWVIVSPDLYEKHPNIFCTGMNFLFSYLNIALIMRRMIQLETPPFDTGSIPLILAALNSAVGKYVQGQAFVNEEYVLYGIWLIYFILFLYFVFSLVDHFTSILGIHVFKIKPRTRKD